MNLNDAKRMVEGLIKKHNLKDWTFNWKRSKRILGTCSYSKKQILLSKSFVMLNSVDIVLKTILHEIAHALTPGMHHNKVWKKKAIELGGSTTRTSKDENLVLAKPKYIYVCLNCGYKARYHKRPKRFVACGACCKKYNHGQWTEKFILRELVSGSSGV